MAAAAGDDCTLRRAIHPETRPAPARRAGHRLSLRHLREPLPGRHGAPETRVAAAVRRRHRRAVGHGDRARTRLARPFGLSREAETRLLHVRLVRAWTGDTDICPRVLGGLLRAVRRSSWRDPDPRRTADATDPYRSEDAPSAPARRVRGRSGPDRRGPFPLPETTHAGASCVRPLDPCRPVRSRRSMSAGTFP